MYAKRGFTLIELLVVIAIIGVLASIVLQNISAGRSSAHEAKTEASLRSAQSVAVLCLDDRHNLNAPDILNDMCSGQEKWPAPVGDSWVYGDVSTCGFDGDVSDNSFQFCATNGTVVISCTQDRCTKI